jgi:predicted enzyme related to lactoylglutathione lyase
MRATAAGRDDSWMTTNLSHFAINADDVPASRAFYESVFGWTFTAWGPPCFFQIQTGTDEHPGIRGALQQRRQLLADRPTTGLECTFAVEDVEATAAAVRAAGGTILLERFTISGVGHLIFFADPAGNPIGAMQYDPSAE